MLNLGSRHRFKRLRIGAVFTLVLIGAQSALLSAQEVSPATSGPPKTAVASNSQHIVAGLDPVPVFHRFAESNISENAESAKATARERFPRTRFGLEDDSSVSEVPSGQPPSLKELPRSILRDQKFLWLRPFRPKRADLPWAAALLGTTAGLISTDSRVGQGLSDSPPGTGFAFSRHVSQVGGSAGDLSVAGAFYLLGRWWNSERARTTGVLAFRAFADSLIVVETLKSITQRPRPTRDRGRLRNENAEGDFFVGGRSFPSGHAAEGWALATVVACQYRHRRWVAPLTYSLAGLVSVARLTQRKHFPSDTFVGGALGYVIGRHVCHISNQPPATATSRRWYWSPSLLPSGGAALTFVWEL